MGLRDGNTITLTIACAIVRTYRADIKQDQDYMALLTEEIGKVAKKSTKRKIVVNVNTADDIKNKSVFGLSPGHRQRWATTVRSAGATGAMGSSPPTAR